MTTIELTTKEKALLRAVKRANEEGRRFKSYEAAFVMTGERIGNDRSYQDWTDAEKAAFRLANDTFGKLYSAGLLHSSHTTWKVGSWRA